MSSKTEEKGEWELRDGKWYKRDSIHVNKPVVHQSTKQAACANCPKYLKQLQEFKVLLAARDKTIHELKAMIAKLQMLLKKTQMEFAKYRESQAGAAKKMLFMEKRILTLEARIKELEAQLHPGPAPLPDEPMSYYYAVQDREQASYFQECVRYQGGDIALDALEGATVLNPDFHLKSEQVPGQHKLRVRVVSIRDVLDKYINAENEVFVRLRLDKAIQFCQPKVLDTNHIQWIQDFVFIHVPLMKHKIYKYYNVSQYELVAEIVVRPLGGTEEYCIGKSSIDLQDMITGLTRIVEVEINGGGYCTLRIKALDFGLSVDHEQSHKVIDPHHTMVVHDVNAAKALDARDGKIDGMVGSVPIKVDHHVRGTTMMADSRQAAIDMDMRDGKRDGKVGGVPIRIHH